MDSQDLSLFSHLDLLGEAEPVPALLCFLPCFIFLRRVPSLLLGREVDLGGGGLDVCL